MLKTIRDDRGVLQVAELPFRAARIFWINNVPEGAVRGGHAHIDCHQYFVCKKGEVEISYYRDGSGGRFTLKEGESYTAAPMTWVTLYFKTTDSEMMVACSEHYNESDYIRDETEFKKLIS